MHFEVHSRLFFIFDLFITTNEPLKLLCFIYYHINFRNRYHIQISNAPMEIIEKNLNSISDPFKREYFKVKKNRDY